MFAPIEPHFVEAAPVALPSPFAVSSAVLSCEGGHYCGDTVTHRVLEDGTLALIVIDVAGRGSAWGPLSYYLATNLLGLLVMQCRLERAASIVEHDFRCEMTPDGPQFASVFAALVDAQTRRMHYISAGHETALVLAGDGSHRHLKTTGPAFGSDAEPHRPASVQFVPGDDLVVVTNGVTDARDAHGVAFGSSGVVGAALRSACSGKDAAWALIDEVSAYGVQEADDRAAVIVTAFD